VSLEKQIFKNDIDKYIQKNCIKKIEDFECQDIIRNTWTIDGNYTFPIKMFGKKKEHLIYLGYNDGIGWPIRIFKKERFVSIVCSFYKREGAGKGMHSPPNSLVHQPFINWKDAIEYFKIHESNVCAIAVLTLEACEQQ